MSTVATDTFRVLVVQPGAEPQEVEVQAGMTVAQLAAKVGLASADRASAVDVMQRSLGPSDVVTPDAEVISFAHKLAGALA